MNENTFDNNKLQEEIDILKSSLEDFVEDSYEYNLINEIKTAIKTINNCKYSYAVLDYINKYYETGLLSPLTLHDDEFPFTGELNRVNKRYNDIIQTPDDDIIYRNAWIPKITHVYDVVNNKEVPIFPDYCELLEYKTVPLYITRGGVCKGDYIIDCYLKQSTIDKHKFIPHSPIEIPCTLEVSTNQYRYSVDAREPKLRALREFYDVREVRIDYHFDIRKYEKLNKNGNN